MSAKTAFVIETILIAAGAGAALVGFPLTGIALTCIALALVLR